MQHVQLHASQSHEELVAQLESGTAETESYGPGASVTFYGMERGRAITERVHRCCREALTQHWSLHRVSGPTEQQR